MLRFKYHVKMWLSLLAKHFQKTTFVIKEVISDHENGSIIHFEHVEEKKTFAKPVAELFNTLSLLKHFDNMDIVEIGKLYAKDQFYKNKTISDITIPKENEK